MAAYLPPGWPTGVHPPGSEGFERTAVAWLLDAVPPDYRLHGVLQRHPIALATLARRHLVACVEGARQGYRTARTELGDVLPVSGVDAVLAAYRSEGHRLVTAARAADLVERALRGKEFTPQLHEAPGPPGQQAQQERQGQQARPEQQAAARAAHTGEAEGQAAHAGEAAASEAAAKTGHSRGRADEAAAEAGRQLALPDRAVEGGDQRCWPTSPTLSSARPIRQARSVASSASSLGSRSSRR